MKKPILIGAFLATLVVLVVAGTKVSRLTRTTDIQGNSLFLVVTGTTELATRAIEATNLLSELFLLPNWVAPASAQNIKTNGTAVNAAATSFDIVTGSNTVVRATNTGGAVTIQINAAAGSGVTTTNANQFGASVELTLKEGVRTTNSLLYGITTNAGDALKLRGVSDPYFEITSIGLPQTFYATSQGIGTRTGGGQAYVIVYPEETATLEIGTDSLRPVNGALVGVGTVSRPFLNGYIQHWLQASNFFLGPALKIMQGSDTPEGAIAANPQSIWLQTNQTTGIGLWLKTNGTGSSGWWLLSPGGGGGGLSDGDKGDITVSGSGSAWAIDAGAVTFAKIQDASVTQRILGRNTSGSGDFEEVTFSQFLDWVGSAAHGDILYRGSSGWSRLGAGTVGQLLQTLGPGVNPAWATVGSLTDNDKGDITVASGGTVWTLDSGVVVSNILAANAVNSSKILDGTVTTNDLAGAINDSLILDGTIGTNKFRQSINDSLILDTTIGTNKLRQAINSSLILDGTIVTADLADSSVSSNKVVADAINSSKIFDGTIVTADLADDSVSSNKVVASAINSSKILDGTIAGVDIPSGILLTNIDVMNLTNRGIARFVAAASFNGVVTNNDRVWLNERINQNDPQLAATFGQLRADDLVVTNHLYRNLLGGTNIALGNGIFQAWTLTTNASFALNFSGTPRNGERVWVGVSNNASSTIFLTNFNGSALANCFDPTVASNVTVFPIAATSARFFTFAWTTNFNLGTVRQQLDHSIEKRLELAVASAGANGFLTILTNAENSIATISNAYMPQAASMVLSNLVNNTSIDFQPGNVITNVGNILSFIHIPAITVSNILMNWQTNNHEMVGCTNALLTNIVELPTGVNHKFKVVIRNTLAVSVPVLLPAFGAQHGYYFHTNGFNDILQATVAPPGTNTVYSFEVDGTNVYPAVTHWRHP